MPESNLKFVEGHWNLNAPAWIRGVRAGRDLFRKAFHDPVFFDLVGRVRGECVLDLGCGEGITCRRLQSEGASVTGIDISAKMINAARRFGPQSINYKVGSFTALNGIGTSKFDKIISTMALMDSPNLLKCCQAVHRSLKPGGRFILSVVHPFTCSGAWKVTGEAADDFVVGNYFRRRRSLECWKFGSADQRGERSFQIPTFPHTMATYLNSIVRAGLSVEQVLEPTPTAANIAKVPRLRPWKRIPFYLMLAARSPD
jgi:2-polyprenyl-3-methyl-5-hydroxy-6-metoxy-1,4-benzoquinol methylase